MYKNVSVPIICAWLFIAATATGQVQTRTGKPLSTAVATDSNEDGVVWVAHDQFIPAQYPGPRAPAVVNGHQFQYLESCRLSKDSEQIGDTTYRVLVRPRKDDETKVEEHYGWIDERLLVKRAEAEIDDTTKIARKVMIVNSQADLKDSAGFSRIVQIHLGPSEDAKKAPPCLLFQAFFKWGETTGKDGKGYVLIGTAEQFNKLDSPANIRKLVLGWVPVSRICRWNTREALYWDAASTKPIPNRRLLPGYVWRTPEDAQAVLPEFIAKGGATNPKHFLAKEVWNEGQTVDAPPRDMRFPILEISTEEREALQKKWGEDPNWERKKIGIVGEFVNEQGVVVATASELENLKAVSEILESQMRRIEVVFVIDDTSSMQPWFGRAAQIIEKIAVLVRTRQERESRKPDVRIGLTYFNDTDGYPDGQHDPVTVHRLVNLAGPEGSAYIRELRNHKPQDGGDPLEKLFDGIERGVTESGFSPYARKLVIALGDAGDHAGQSTERFQRLVKALTPTNKSSFDFSAILVMSAEQAAMREPARAFQQQMQALESQLNMGNPSRKRAMVRTSDKAEEVETMILANFRALEEEATKVGDQLTELRRGQWGKTQLSPDVRTAISRSMPNWEQLEKVKGGVQLFEEGYVWIRRVPDDHLPIPDSFCHLLSIGEGDLQHMIRLLKSLETTRQQSGHVDPLEIVKRAIESQVDDPKQAGSSFQDAIFKAKGITVLSPLLNRQIQSARRGSFKFNELFELEHKRQLLEDIHEEREYRYEVKKEVIGGVPYDRYVRVGEPSPKPRKFHFGELKDVNWYWIDKHKEWP